MQNSPLRHTSLRLLSLAGFVGLPLHLALGHEAHHAECNETAINALKVIFRPWARVRQRRQPRRKWKRRNR